jgi:hypothetical protein
MHRALGGCRVLLDQGFSRCHLTHKEAAGMTEYSQWSPTISVPGIRERVV